MKQKLYTMTCLLVITALLLTACGSTAATDTPQAATKVVEEAAPTAAPTQEEEKEEPKSIIVTFFEEPDSLNPYYTQMWFSWLAIDLFDVGLWSIDDNLEMHLEMATEVPTVENGGISQDGTVLTIPLRQDAQWSDGTLVTAHDFVFSYQMIMDDNNTVQTRYPYDPFVQTVKALDDYTLEITMSDPYVAWNTGLFKDVLPKHILEPVYEAEGSIDNAEWNRQPTVGNGPFVFKEWQSGSHMTFEANPNYWRGEPKIDQIFIRIVPDTEAQMAAIQAGDTDIGAYMTAADKPTIDALDHMALTIVPSAWIESWFFNLDPETGHPALQEIPVRQALVMAVDRQQIIDELFYGLYKIPATFWYDTPYEDPSIEPWPYDPARAQALLDEAGWVDSNGDGIRDKDGQELVLRYSTTSGNELREATQVVVQQMLADVGIGIEIQNYSYDTIWVSYGEDGPLALGGYDIAEWSDGAYDYPDPNWPYFLCSEIPTDDYPDGLNWYGICDPELDALLQKQAVTVDLEERIEMYHEIERIMHDQVLWVGIRTDPDLWAVNTNLQNLQFSGVDCFWNAYEWDISQ